MDVTKISTEQEAFNHIVETLNARGWTRAGTETKYDGFLCCYRGMNNQGCAIGILITDDEYIAIGEIEGEGVDTILYRLPTRIQRLHHLFITALQYAHDEGVTPEKMRELFKYVAEKYDLKVPPCLK